jgi:hypothetical protein
MSMLRMMLLMPRRSSTLGLAAKFPVLRDILSQPRAKGPPADDTSEGGEIA